MQTNTHQIMVMSFYYRLHIGSEDEDEDEECFWGRNDQFKHHHFHRI